jgi:hypothetical protein
LPQRVLVLAGNQIYLLLAGKGIVIAEFLLGKKVLDLRFPLLLRRLAVCRNNSLVGAGFLLPLLLLCEIFHLVGLILQRVVIGGKKLLELRLAQEKGVLLDEFSLLLILNGDLLVLVEVALLHHGDEGRLDVLAAQLLPVEAVKPRVALQLIDSSAAQS